MADVIDRANDRAQEELDQVLEQRRNAPRQESEHWCEECGFEIPPKRRELVPGCTTCVDCQEFIERSGGR